MRRGLSIRIRTTLITIFFLVTFNSLGFFMYLVAQYLTEGQSLASGVALAASNLSRSRESELKFRNDPSESLAIVSQAHISSFKLQKLTLQTDSFLFRDLNEKIGTQLNRLAELEDKIETHFDIIINSYREKGFEFNTGKGAIILGSIAQLEEIFTKNQDSELLSRIFLIRVHELEYQITEQAFHLSYIHMLSDELKNTIQSSSINEKQTAIRALDKYMQAIDDITALNEKINESNQSLGEGYNGINYEMDQMREAIIDSTESLKDNIQFYGIIVLALISLIIIAFNIFMRISILSPISKTSGMFKEISEGAGDLSKRVKFRNVSNEINQLSNYFNHFLDFLSGMILEIRYVMQKAQEVSSNLSKSSESSSNYLERMNKDVIETQSKISHLDQEVVQVNEATTQMKNSIHQVTELISEQFTSIHESSASVEEMSASIRNIARVTESRLQVVEKLEKTASRGEAEMKETAQMIQEVANSAHIIRDMIGVINDIAEQTNLLAMNAAIEAAHAGDAGRGFAVVSDEIRRLAENTSRNSVEISRSLKQVIEYIHLSAKNTQQTGELFQDIVMEIKQVASSMIEMKSATEEIASGSGQVMDALSSLIQVSEKVNVSSDDMTSNIDNISHSIRNLQMVSKDNLAKMQDFSSNIQELYNTIETVSINGNKNSEGIVQLENLVNQFKIEDDSIALPDSETKDKTLALIQNEGNGKTNSNNDISDVSHEISTESTEESTEKTLEKQLEEELEETLESRPIR